MFDDSIAAKMVSDLLNPSGLQNNADKKAYRVLSINYNLSRIQMILANLLTNGIFSNLTEQDFRQIETCSCELSEVANILEEILNGFLKGDGREQQ